MKKRIILDAFGNERPKERTKRKPVKPYVEPEWLTKYKADRDIIIDKL